MLSRVFALAVPALLIHKVSAYYGPYIQQARWQGANFFNGFDFFTSADPTHGFVKYVDQGTAEKNGLISTNGGAAYVGVDYTTSLAAGGSQGGRQSIRLESKAKYTEGLFIIDANHMPGGICGTWPAFWTYGANWPNQGEIDILEGVNAGDTNLVSLHTSDQCSISGTGMKGTVVTGNCYQYDPAQPSSGCGIRMNTPNAYGAGFNAVSGGVHVMEWTGRFIHTWFFPRNAIPKDILAGAPTPWTWGPVQTRFNGACNIPDHFRDHRVVLDTTFCGDWAGSVFGSDPVCAPKGSCQAYVANSPGDFKDAYWSINYVAVYKSAGRLVPDALMRVAVNDTGSTSTTQIPLASTNPAVTETIENIAAGATNVAAAPGVDPPVNVPARELDQVPAIANVTNADN